MQHLKDTARRCGSSMIRLAAGDAPTTQQLVLRMGWKRHSPGIDQQCHSPSWMVTMAPDDRVAHTQVTHRVIISHTAHQASAMQCHGNDAIDSIGKMVEGFESVVCTGQRTPQRNIGRVELGGKPTHGQAKAHLHKRGALQRKAPPCGNVLCTAKEQVLNKVVRLGATPENEEEWRACARMLWSAAQSVLVSMRVGTHVCMCVQSMRLMEL